jgi:hypothetical protein
VQPSNLFVTLPLSPLSQRNGILSKEEIEKGLILAKDFKKSIFSDVERCVVGEHDVMVDLPTMFDAMDKDGSGDFSIDEFLNAFMDRRARSYQSDVASDKPKYVHIL